MSSMKKKNSWSVIYVGKLPIRPWCLVSYLLFCQWNSLNLWLGWKHIQLSLGLMSFVQLSGKLSPCVYQCVYVLCKFRLFVFSSSVVSKLKSKKKNLLLLKRLQCPNYQFVLKMKALTLSVSAWNWIWNETLCPLCRCWGLFRSGVALQPWSRSCFDAAASSSTALSWACSSWLPPSRLTPAPRGQILAGNVFVTLTFKLWLNILILIDGSVKPLKNTNSEMSHGRMASLHMWEQVQYLVFTEFRRTKLKLQGLD